MPRFRSAALFYIQYPEGYDTVYQYQSDYIIFPERPMCSVYRSENVILPNRSHHPLVVLYQILLENFEHFTLPNIDYIPYLVPRFMCFYPQLLSTMHVPSQDNHAAGVREVSEHSLSCFP